MAAKNSNEVMSITLIKKNEPDRDLQWPRSVMIEKILVLPKSCDLFPKASVDLVLVLVENFLDHYRLRPLEIFVRLILLY